MADIPSILGNGHQLLGGGITGDTGNTLSVNEDIRVWLSELVEGLDDFDVVPPTSP